jgi:hypothetical protein
MPANPKRKNTLITAHQIDSLCALQRADSKRLEPDHNGGFGAHCVHVAATEREISWG